jgi:folate-binding protein YgfZ
MSAEAGRALPPGGFLVRTDRELLEIAGRDRVKFLNGYLTADLARLEPGALASGFLTSREGRVLADVDAVEVGGALRLSVPAGRGDAIRHHLERYVLAAEVAIAPQPERVVVGIYGAEAASLAPPLGALARDLGAIPGWELWIERGEAAARLAALTGAGIPELEGSGFDQLRVAAAFGLFGVDFDERHFPQETGRGAATVSTTKGCYLGQEVVARIHFRGGVQRSLRALAFPAGPAPGAALLVEGREAGRLGTVVADGPGGAVGLAVLHRRAGAAGARVELEGGGSATLFDPPFAAP